MAETTYDVYRKNFQYDDWDDMYKVLYEYAQNLKLDIVVSIPRRETRPVETEEGKLFIKNFCCVDGGKDERCIIPSAYGFEVNSHQEDAMEPTGLLFTVYDGDGVAVAEFAKGCIFVLFELPHGDNSGLLIKLIMEDYLAFLRSEKEFDEVVNRRISRASFNNFSRLYNHELKQQRSMLDQNIANCDDELSRHQKAIIQTTKQRESWVKKRKLAKNMLDEFPESLLLEKYEALKRLSANGEIYVEKKMISIFAGQIDIEFKGVVYDIGEFEIQIFPDGEWGGIKCINLTREVDGYYHPHISDDGECCLGNISESVALLIGTMEYDVVIILMMQFLRTCYEDGWYHEVTNWPIKNGGQDGTTES